MGVFKCNGGYIVDSTRLQGLAIANADGESEGTTKILALLWCKFIARQLFCACADSGNLL